MTREKDKESKKIIHPEEIIGDSFHRKITSNTSEPPPTIPIFTTGDGDESDESSSVETESTE